MFACFTRLKKVLSVISISALAVFGLNTIATAAAPTSTVTLTQGTFSNAVVSTDQACFYYTGLDGSGRWVFSDLVLTADDNGTPVTVTFSSSRTISSNANGVGEGLCFDTQVGGEVRNAGILDFEKVADISLAGSARSAVTVSATFQDADGNSVDGTASGYELATNLLTTYVSGITSGKKVTFTNILVVAHAETGIETSVNVNDTEYNGNNSGSAALALSSLQGGDLSSLGALSGYIWFNVSYDVVLSDATTPPPTGNLVQSFGTFDASAMTENTIERVPANDFIQSDMVCWGFGGADANSTVKASDINVSIDAGLDTVQSWEGLSVQMEASDTGEFTYCFEASTVDPDNQPDLSQFNTIELSTITFSSVVVISDIFAKYASSRGFKVDMAPSMYFQDWAGLNRTNVSVELKNETDERLAYRVIGLQLGTSELTDYDPLWVVQAQSSTYVNLGNASGDKTVGSSSIDVWAMVQPVTASTLNVRGLKLPAGVQVVGDSLDLPYFGKDAGDYANKTMMSLTLRNTTDEDITIAGALAWKVGSTKVKSVGSQVVTIPAGETTTFFGSNSVQAMAAGDVRYGKALTVTGTLKSVAANEVNVDNFVVPEEVTTVRWVFDYDDAAKKTIVSLVLGTEFNQEDETLNDYRDLRAIDDVPVKIGNKETGTYPVAAVPAQAGGWTQFIPRITEIATLPGDQRYGKTIAVTATFEFSDRNLDPVTDELTNTRLEDAGCAFYSLGADWDLTVKNGQKKTTVEIYCYNYNKYDVKLNFSGMSGSFISPEDGETEINLTRLSGISNIRLKQGKNQMVKIFDAPGDIRTGGIQLTFTGAIGISK